MVGYPRRNSFPSGPKCESSAGAIAGFPLAEDFLAEREAHPLDDAFWASKRPILENIEVPALVCANWSDHGLHTRGSIEGFERISSKQKWLFTHGRKKWETFYGEEALAWQKRFLDHFLRDFDNGMDRVPRVRLEVRKAYYQTRGAQRGELATFIRAASPALSLREYGKSAKRTGRFRRQSAVSACESKRKEQFFLADSSGRLN